MVLDGDQHVHHFAVDQLPVDHLAAGTRQLEFLVRSDDPLRVALLQDELPLRLERRTLQVHDVGPRGRRPRIHDQLATVPDLGLAPNDSSLR